VDADRNGVSLDGLCARIPYTGYGIGIKGNSIQRAYMNHYIASSCDWSPGAVISNATLADSPQETFFVQCVPQNLSANADYTARRDTELQLEELRRRSLDWSALFPYLEPDADYWVLGPLIFACDEG
jgi:hypothetical protein